MSETLNLSDYCDACQAIPRHGYCNLKGCPKPRPTPPRGGEAVTAAEDRGDGGGLIERLRARQYYVSAGGRDLEIQSDKLCDEAADEIERLNALVSRLEETIRAVDDHLDQIESAADSFRDCDGDEVASQVIIRVEATRARLSARQEGGGE